MALTWIDARIDNAHDEEQPRKEQDMGKNITTNKRLYDKDAHGISFLAYPVGAEVPEAEYKRLTAGKGPVEHKMRGPVENKAVEPGKPLKRMNKDELLAVAASLGIDAAGKTNREVIEAIEAANAGTE